MKAQWPGPAWLADLAIVFVLLGAAWGLTVTAMRFARPALLDLGPNDVEYVGGFREDWERERHTRFHWTTLSSVVRLPIYAGGEGHLLRVRARRHFEDPATVTIRAEGRQVARFTIAADLHEPYQLLTFPMPALEGRHPLVLTLDSAVSTARPLGLALDWLEVERGGPRAWLRLPSSFALALGLVCVTAFAAPRLAGAGRTPALAHAALLAVGAALGAWAHPVAAERVVRLGAGPYLLAAAVALLVVRWPRAAHALGLEARTWIAGGLAMAVLLALAIRLVLLLHPQFYYPDVKVHALFSWQLARRGIVAFLRDFTENQFRYSLGLQLENGHWYAFPYPPVFYLLTWPLVRLAQWRAEVAVSVVAAMANSVGALLVFAIARRLGARAGTALAAAGALALLPLFIRRLTLAYFPAMVGHFVDALVILYLLSRLGRLAQPRVIFALASLIAAALLTYTQSIINLGILLPLFVVLQLARDRSPASRRDMGGLVVAGALGATLALAVFYGRYVPIFIDMQRGIPMPEERILFEKPPSPPDPDAKPEPPDDPFAGPTFDPIRGVKKAAWRLYVFYRAFAPLVLAGLLLAVRSASPIVRPFVIAWALTYLLLNLASGGLPGPNLVRYNKDLEIVAPLFLYALARVGEWLWERSRALAALYAASYVVFGVVRAVRDLTDRFVLER